MSIAVTSTPHRHTILRRNLRLGAAGVLVALLAGCSDDDPWEDFQPFDVPNSVGIADMNSDGRNDVVAAYTHIAGPYPNAGYASVILQTASPGIFARGLDSAVGANPSTLAVADINNVGSPDVAVANAYSGSVSVLLQSADTGQFSTSVTLSVGGTPFDVALGTLDGDTLADVVVANASSSNITVFRQD
ncbi:MAG: VCBS repeat-containing protein, partial [Candidatus Binatota bacterium]|nr:VCBS repeat-containing protein [Candidatus Binatota bacterium]